MSRSRGAWPPNWVLSWSASPSPITSPTSATRRSATSASHEPAPSRVSWNGITADIPALCLRYWTRSTSPSGIISFDRTSFFLSASTACRLTLENAEVADHELGKTVSGGRISGRPHSYSLCSRPPDLRDLQRITRTRPTSTSHGIPASRATTGDASNRPTEAAVVQPAGLSSGTPA